MSVTQTLANKSAFSLVAINEAGGIALLAALGVKVGAGTGSPNGVITAEKGSLFLDVSVPKLYMNTDGATAWLQQMGITHFYAAVAAAAAADSVHAGITDAGDGTDSTVTTGITNPDVPRNITATSDDVSGDNADIKAVQVIITGTNWDDEVITETLPIFTVNSSDLVAGSKAFKTVTSIFVPAMDTPYDALVTVGYGDILGLPVSAAHISCIDAFLDDTLEGTAATIVASATAIESCTIDLNSSLDGSDVDAYLITP